MDKIQKTRKIIASKKDLAYAAGIMDGEGTFSIVIRGRGKYHWYQDTLRIHMDDEIVIDFFCTNFGGNKYKRLENKKHTFIWQVWGKQARTISQELLPYLLAKRRQAEIVLEMGKIKEKSKRFQKDPEYIRNQKFELYNELKSLHQRAYSHRPTILIA